MLLLQMRRGVVIIKTRLRAWHPREAVRISGSGKRFISSPQRPDRFWGPTWHYVPINYYTVKEQTLTDTTNPDNREKFLFGGAKFHLDNYKKTAFCCNFSPVHYWQLLKSILILSFHLRLDHCSKFLFHPYSYLSLDFPTKNILLHQHMLHVI